MEINAETLAKKGQEKIAINGCNYHILSSEFYKQMNDDAGFLEQNLLTLEEKAKNISLPLIYGEFIDEAHYLNSIEILFLSTAETKNREIFLEKLILPKIKTKDKFLEIGLGDGALVKKIEAEFESITIVDNNEKILQSIQDMPAEKIELIACDFVNFYSRDTQYNLILMSHLLYYIDPNLWENLIIRAYKSLAPGGVLVIIISDGLEKQKIESFFGGALFPIEQTILNCDFILDTDSEKYISVETFVSRSLIAMQHIANVLLNDAKCKVKEESVINYIEKFCRKKQRYSISTYQKFFVFQAGD